MRSGFRPRSLAKGVSLVELMVAMVIGLILMAGVIQIYLGTWSTNRAQEGLSRVQENGRFAMEVLTRSLRMGGHSLCTGQTTGPDELPVRLRASNADSLPLTDDVLDLNRGIEGAAEGRDLWDDGAPENLVDGTPALRLMHAAGSATNARGEDEDNPNFQGSNFDIMGNPGDIDQGDLVLITDCNTADVFRVTSEPGDGDVETSINIAHGGNFNSPQNWNQIDNSYDENSRVARFAARTFYVATNGQGTPSLFMQRRANETVEVVENVEALAFAYGLDTSGNGQVDAYEAADSVDDWARVLSIRVGLLLRSDEVLAENRQTTYDMLGQETLQFDDRRIRQLAVSTISLRNRLP